MAFLNTFRSSDKILSLYNNYVISVYVMGNNFFQVSCGKRVKRGYTQRGMKNKSMNIYK